MVGAEVSGPLRGIHRSVAEQFARHNARLDALFDLIEREYGDIRLVKDKKSGELVRHYENSVTINAMSLDIPMLEKRYPNFKFSHVQGMYYLCAFKKPENWGILRMPELP